MVCATKPTHIIFLERNYSSVPSEKEWIAAMEEFWKAYNNIWNNIPNLLSKAEELEQKAEKVFAWLNDILRKRINFCDHSLGEEFVYSIILRNYHYATQTCEFRYISTLLPLGIQPNRILQTPLLIHFAHSCQQPRLS